MVWKEKIFAHKQRTKSRVLEEHLLEENIYIS